MCTRRTNVSFRPSCDYDRTRFSRRVPRPGRRFPRITPPTSDFPRTVTYRRRSPCPDPTEGHHARHPTDVRHAGTFVAPRPPVALHHPQGSLRAAPPGGRHTGTFDTYAVSARTSQTRLRHIQNPVGVSTVLPSNLRSASVRTQRPWNLGTFVALRSVSEASSGVPREKGPSRYGAPCAAWRARPRAVVPWRAGRPAPRPGPLPGPPPAPARRWPRPGRTCPVRVA